MARSREVVRRILREAVLPYRGGPSGPLFSPNSPASPGPSTISTLSTISIQRLQLIHQVHVTDALRTSTNPPDSTDLTLLAEGVEPHDLVRKMELALRLPFPTSTLSTRSIAHRQSPRSTRSTPAAGAPLSRVDSFSRRESPGHVAPSGRPGPPSSRICAIVEGVRSLDLVMILRRVELRDAMREMDLARGPGFLDPVDRPSSREVRHSVRAPRYLTCSIRQPRHPQTHPTHPPAQSLDPGRPEVSVRPA